MCWSSDRGVLVVEAELFSLTCAIAPDHVLIAVADDLLGPVVTLARFLGAESGAVLATGSVAVSAHLVAKTAQAKEYGLREF